MIEQVGGALFFDLGQTATPGAQSLTVPADATHVAILFALSDDSATPNAVVSSLSSTFAGTFQIDNSVSTAVSYGGSICRAAVTSTGAGKTFTPVLSSPNTVGAAIACVLFLKGVDSSAWLGATTFGFGHATGAGTTAGTATATGAAGGKAFAFDTRAGTTAGVFPANEASWTSVATGQAGPGALTYYSMARLRSLDLSSAGSVSATTQTTFASVISLLTVPAAPAVVSAAITMAGATVAAALTAPVKVDAAITMAGATVAATLSAFDPRTLDASIVMAGCGVSAAIEVRAAVTWAKFAHGYALKTQFATSYALKTEFQATMRKSTTFTVAAR